MLGVLPSDLGINIQPSKHQLDLPLSYMLHLSDLHFSSIQEMVPWLDCIEADLTQLKKMVPQIDALVISGDLTQRAAPTEFAAAEEFINGLRSYLRLGQPQIIITGCGFQAAQLRAAEGASAGVT